MQGIRVRSRVVVLDSEQYALEQCVNCDGIIKICHFNRSHRRAAKLSIGLFGLMLIAAFSAFSGGYAIGNHAESVFIEVAGTIIFD